MKYPCRLTQLSSGGKVRICALSDRPEMRGRLCAMGLTPGSEVYVYAVHDGLCSVSVRGCRLVLGEGMAAQILCEPLAE